MFPETAKTIAHVETKKRLQRMNDPDRPFPYGMFVGGKPVPLPTITFEDSYTLKVGHQELRLEYKGDDHEPGNIYIYARKTKSVNESRYRIPGLDTLQRACNCRGYSGLSQGS